MNLNQLRKSLEETGAEVELIEAGRSRALVLKRLPPSAQSDGGNLWIVDGDVADLLDPGAHVLGTERLKIGDVTVPVTRIEAPSLRAHGGKIGEGPGNLEGRAGWFNKRH